MTDSPSGQPAPATSPQAAANAVVITGTGLACGLGLDAAGVWEGVCAGRSAAGAMPALEQGDPPREGFQAPELPAEEADPDAPREVRYLRHVLAAALRDAGLGGAGENRWPCEASRVGIVLGTTLHGMRAGGEYFRQGNVAPLGRFQAAAVIQRAAAGLGVQGPAVTTCAACSSGLSSIELGRTLLRSGELDLVIAGGYDTISEYAYGGFHALRLIAPGPVRPFCADRLGMKLGEGYGILLLERAADAARRGAPQQWRVLGAGETADAHHLTQPHPEGDGAARAMEHALAEAGLAPDQVSMIGAHATGTPGNDRGEAAALARVFGRSLASVPIVAFKSHLGHTLGGAGAVELILTIQALRHQRVPPTANLDPADVEYPSLHLVTGAPRPGRLTAAMNLSIGFGGANTALLIAPPPQAAPPPEAASEAPPQVSSQAAPPPAAKPAARVHVFSSSEAGGPHRVVVTGMGVVFPGLVGRDAFARRLRDPQARPITTAPPPIDPARIADLLQTRRVRRMSDYVKLSLAATRLAWDHAGLPAGADPGQATAAILGTAHGSARYSADYYRQLVEEGLDAANPMLFAEGVPNAGAAHLSLMLGLKGPCQTIIGSRTAGLDALRLAGARIAGGQWERAIVSTAEEATDLVRLAYEHCHMHAPIGGGEAGAAVGGLPFEAGAGFVMGQGAATLVLEREDVAKARGAVVHAVIEAGAASTTDPADRGQGPGAWAAPDPRAAAEAARRAIQGLDGLDVPPPGAVITSADATALGCAQLAGWPRGGRRPTVTSLYGHVAQTFSVMPIAALIAAAVTGRLPRLFGPAPRRADPASPDTPGIDRLLLLCSDPHGPVAAAAVALP